MSDTSRRELADAISAASGPDRMLDCRIWLIAGELLGRPYTLRGTDGILPSETMMGRTFGMALEQFPSDVEGVAHSWRVPRFTASIDAARRLLANIGYVLWHPLGKRPSVSTQTDEGWSEPSSGYREPLALCAAALLAGGPIIFGRADEQTDLDGRCVD